MRLEKNFYFLSDYYGLNLYIVTKAQNKADDRVVVYSDNYIYFYVVFSNLYNYYYDSDTREYLDLPLALNEALHYIISSTATKRI